MQRHGAGIACHSGTTDFAGALQPLDYCVDDFYGFDFDPTSSAGTVVVAADPYICNGGAVEDGCGDEVVRKRRRLVSNRESARRARVRKRRRLDELSSRAARLAAANHELLVELNRVIAEHGRVARESARLREEARELRGKLDAAMEQLEEEEAAGAGEDAAAATLPPPPPPPEVA